MRCEKVEKLILRSFDHVLRNGEEDALKTHLAQCPHCRDLKQEYEEIHRVLGASEYPEPTPYFWERLYPRLDEQPFRILPLGKLWAWRLLPAAISIVVMLAAGLTFFKLERPRVRPDEMSEAEILLLKDLNPFQETRSVFEAENIENKNMMLIFSSLEKDNGLRRYFP